MNNTTLKRINMKLNRIQEPSYKNIDVPNYDIINNVIGRLSNDLNKQIEDYVIEGLKRRGFVFSNRFELEEFVKQRCRCEDNTDIKERVYYVDNTPFFLHNYKIEPSQMPLITDREYKINANLGTYAYL